MTVMTYVTHTWLWMPPWKNKARKPQKNQTLFVAVGIASNFSHHSTSCRSKILGYGLGFGLRSNTGRARSKTLDFLQILRKEKVGKARILNYLCSFDVLSQEIAATAAVRTSLWSKGCKF